MHDLRIHAATRATPGAVTPPDSPRLETPTPLPARGDGLAPHGATAPDLGAARTRLGTPAAPANRPLLGTAGTALRTTAAQAAAIKAGAHQIRRVGGDDLRFPSQDLRMIESSEPFAHGQTHVLTKHVGPTLADDIARLQREPHIRGAGGFTDLATAQSAVDRTIANPLAQKAIGLFIDRAGQATLPLPRVALGETIGHDLSRSDFANGNMRLTDETTATVVLIKDPTFPEGYRILTAYPDGRPPQAAPDGTALAR